MENEDNKIQPLKKISKGKPSRMAKKAIKESKKAKAGNPYALLIVYEKIQEGTIKDENDLPEEHRSLYHLITRIPELINNGISREAIVKKLSSELRIERSYVRNTYDGINRIIGEQVLNGNDTVFMLAETQKLKNISTTILQKLMIDGKYNDAAQLLKFVRDLNADIYNVSQEHKKEQYSPQMPTPPKII